MSKKGQRLAFFDAGLGVSRPAAGGQGAVTGADERIVWGGLRFAPITSVVSGLDLGPPGIFRVA